MVDKFKTELRRALVDSQKHSHLSPSAMAFDGLGRRMLDARDSGVWNEKQLLDNLTVAFVAGQENPQLCMISTLYLLAKHPVRPRAFKNLTSTVADGLDRESKPNFTPRSRAGDWATQTGIQRSCRTCLS
jgi:cytochrome P450